MVTATEPRQRGFVGFISRSPRRFCATTPHAGVWFTFFTPFTPTDTPTPKRKPPTTDDAGRYKVPSQARSDDDRRPSPTRSSELQNRRFAERDLGPSALFRDHHHAFSAYR